VLNSYDAFETAVASFQRGRVAASGGELSAALIGFAGAVAQAGELWPDTNCPAEVRNQAARLAADSAYAAGAAAAQHGDPTSPLEEATALGIEIYNNEELEADVRLHGVYRAQCAAFELGHALVHAKPERAIEVFRDAVMCAEAAREFPLSSVDAEKVARTLANASASALVLARTLRDAGDSRYRSDLLRARELGSEVLEGGDLGPSLRVEAMLVMGEVHFELAQTEEKPEIAADHLESALGWSREASQAPGADALLQAQAFQRGANYACVYGLYVRGEDFEKGMDALEGAVHLALAAASPDTPPEIRAGGWDTAVRTQQNIALLLKERDPHAAGAAFAASVVLATRASEDLGLPEGHRGQHLYLKANGLLEQAILAQLTSGVDDDPAAVRLLVECCCAVEEVLTLKLVPPDVRARAALVGCGAWGRRGAGEECQEAIVRLATVAADTDGADPEHRDRGVSFAAQANQGQRVTSK
jgi:hypothetical protein